MSIWIHAAHAHAIRAPRAISSGSGPRDCPACHCFAPIAFNCACCGHRVRDWLCLELKIMVCSRCVCGCFLFRERRCLSNIDSHAQSRPPLLSASHCCMLRSVWFLSFALFLLLFLLQLHDVSLHLLSLHLHPHLPLPLPLRLLDAQRTGDQHPHEESRTLECRSLLTHVDAG